MKKILLSIVALIAVVSSVKAEDAVPTYTAVGTVAVGENSGYNSVVSSALTDVAVEVYGKDSIIVRKWCGVDTYDLCVKFNADGVATEAKSIQDGVVASGAYQYPYTGLSDCTTLCVYMDAWEGSYYISADFGDETTKTGYLELWGYGYKGQSYLGYYYYSISWPATDAGISGVTVDEAAADAPTYNLAGQRVAADTKGLVIKNGKKFINK